MRHYQSTRRTSLSKLPLHAPDPVTKRVAALDGHALLVLPRRERGGGKGPADASVRRVGVGGRKTHGRVAPAGAHAARTGARTRGQTHHCRCSKMTLPSEEARCEYAMSPTAAGRYGCDVPSVRSWPPSPPPRVCQRLVWSSYLLDMALASMYRATGTEDLGREESVHRGCLLCPSVLNLFFFNQLLFFFPLRPRKENTMTVNRCGVTVVRGPTAPRDADD